MDWWTKPLQYLLGMFSFAWHPGYVLFGLMVAAHVWWLARATRKLVGNPLEPPLPLLGRTLGMGILAGVAASLLFAFSRWDIRLDDGFWIWSVTAVLAVFHLRWACLACSAGLLTLGSLALQQAAWIPVEEPWRTLAQTLAVFDGETWCWLACLLHFVEWALIRADGAFGVMPIQTKHAESDQVSGIMMKKGWPVPLLLPTPFGLFPVPVFLSFGRMTLSKPLKQQKRLASTCVFLYALVFLGGMLLTEVWPAALWGVALYSVAGHEGLYWWGRKLEKRNSPLFVSDSKGLKVLMVIPGTPAAELGLSSGDVIQRLNGRPIRTMEDLAQAVENAAYCKMEVLDAYQHRHILQKALYEGVPPHLGIVGAIPFEAKKTEAVEEFRTVGSSS